MRDYRQERALEPALDVTWREGRSQTVSSDRRPRYAPRSGAPACLTTSSSLMRRSEIARSNDGRSAAEVTAEPIAEDPL